MTDGRKLLILLVSFGLATNAAAAVSPFGVGLPDPGGGGLIPWVAALQKQFYSDLTAALAQLKASGQAFPWLAGISFLYGVFHAAGPGHGKMVISSYLVANKESARRGVGLAFASAMLQAIVAVLIVGAMAAALNLTSFAITRTAEWLEIGSYALVLALGIYLLGKKVRQLRSGGHHHHHDHHRCHGHADEQLGAERTGQADQALGARRGGLAAVVAVGLRPCSGALVVLVFALAQGIFWAGIASTFLMGLGTAFTVAALAALAVGAKGLAARLAGGPESRLAGRAVLGLELAGALLVTGLGAVLLLGALSA